MCQRARVSLNLPHMDVNIANAAVSCDKCVSRIPSLPAEPMKPHKPATRPYEFLHVNLGEVDGRHFLVIVDQFNSWPAAIIECSQTKKNTRRFINASRTFFMDTGVAPLRFTVKTANLEQLNSNMSYETGAWWSDLPSQTILK